MVVCLFADPADTTSPSCARWQRGPSSALPLEVPKRQLRGPPSSSAFDQMLLRRHSTVTPFPLSYHTSWEPCPWLPRCYLLTPPQVCIVHWSVVRSPPSEAPMNLNRRLVAFCRSVPTSRKQRPLHRDATSVLAGITMLVFHVVLLITHSQSSLVLQYL